MTLSVKLENINSQCHQVGPRVQHPTLPSNLALGGTGHGNFPVCLVLQPPPLAKPSSRHQPHEKLRSHVSLRESKLLGQFFQTSMGTDYYPFGMQRPQKALTLHWQRSNLPEGSGGERGPSPPLTPEGPALGWFYHTHCPTLAPPPEGLDLDPINQDPNAASKPYPRDHDPHAVPHTSTVAQTSEQTIAPLHSCQTLAPPPINICICPAPDLLILPWLLPPPRLLRPPRLLIYPWLQGFSSGLRFSLNPNPTLNLVRFCPLRPASPSVPQLDHSYPNFQNQIF